MVSDMKHSTTPIGHDLIASSAAICTDPQTSDGPMISLVCAMAIRNLERLSDTRYVILLSKN